MGNWLECRLPLAGEENGAADARRAEAATATKYTTNAQLMVWWRPTAAISGVDNLQAVRRADDQSAAGAAVHLLGSGGADRQGDRLKPQGQQA